MPLRTSQISRLPLMGQKPVQIKEKNLGVVGAPLIPSLISNHFTMRVPPIVLVINIFSNFHNLILSYITTTCMAECEVLDEAKRRRSKSCFHDNSVWRKKFRDSAFVRCCRSRWRILRIFLRVPNFRIIYINQFQTITRIMCCCGGLFA